MPSSVYLGGPIVATFVLRAPDGAEATDPVKTLKLIGPDGKEVSGAERGFDELKKAFMFDGTGDRMWWIPPGEGMCRDLDLRKCYHMDKPGVYRISASFGASLGPEEWFESLEVKDLEFKVESAPLVVGTK